MTPIIDNPLSWLYLPTALGLGALHALEPGHAKTLTAAYLIGIKGTKRDAFFLGLSVAITHSIVVVAISMLALTLGRQTFAADAIYWLQVGSAMIVVILGSWMLMKRLRRKRHLEGHHHDDNHDHMSDDEHARAHAATLPTYVGSGERPTLGQIIVFGAAGGMIPCPASITVMLLALSIGQYASGLLTLLAFSLGLAITLVGVGMMVVAGISRFHSSSGRLHWLSTQAPIISAAVVILSGLAALLFVH